MSPASVKTVLANDAPSAELGADGVCGRLRCGDKRTLGLEEAEVAPADGCSALIWSGAFGSMLETVSGMGALQRIKLATAAMQRSIGELAY